MKLEAVKTTLIRLVDKPLKRRGIARRSRNQRGRKPDSTQRSQRASPRVAEEKLSLRNSAPAIAVLSHRIVARREDFLDCGGKRSATPLWDRPQPWPSGVALRFPPQSKTHWWRLRRAMSSAPRRSSRHATILRDSTAKDPKVPKGAFPASFRLLCASAFDPLGNHPDKQGMIFPSYLQTNGYRREVQGCGRSSKIRRASQCQQLSEASSPFFTCR